MLNVVLFCPEIPPNTGNIGRLCHATGATLHLIEPLGFSIDDRAVKRAGLDYWEELAPVIWPSYDAFTAALPDDATLYFLTTKTDRVYWDASFERGDYLIFGPETRGIPETLLERNYAKCLTIPQIAGRSLNLATSAGIVLYEAIKQVTKK
jgi:tRNA (cytidine/uridine-2'-O-)-methyltransferase